MENSRWDLSNFNFSGVCSNPFKYKANNKSDLIFNTIYYNGDNQWKKHKESILEAIELSHQTVPHATKIVYLYGNINDDEFERMFKENGYSIVRSPMKFGENEKKYIVSQRYQIGRAHV